MRQLESTMEADSAIGWACAGFVAQVRPVVSFESLAVVLLDQEKATSRVVFSWQTPNPSGVTGSLSTARGTGMVRADFPTTFVTLGGGDGPLGAVLLRRASTVRGGPVEQRLLQKPVERLAALLDNIVLRQRLERSARERQAFDRMGELAGASASVDCVYQLFAAEIKKLVDYQRLSVYLADRDADLLTCAYRVGLGVPRKQTLVTRTLSGTGCGAVVSSGQGSIVDDLQPNGERCWPELSGGVPLRSAVVVPVTCGGIVIGAVALENRLPNAYGPLEESLLRRAAMLLGPPIATSDLYSQLGEQAREMAAANEIARIIASSRRLEEVLQRFASAAIKLVGFECVTLAWIDSNGCDIRTLRAFPGSDAAGDLPPDERLVSIDSRLLFGRSGIGALTLWRRSDEPFTRDDVATLDRLGIQISSAVQYDRLYQQAQRQAYQLGQFHRTRPQTDRGPVPVDPAADHTAESAGPTNGGRDIGRGKAQLRLESLRRDLLVDAAHALRSPLSSIKGYSSTLLQPDVTWSPELHQEFLETIDREADQLNRAVDDLLGTTETESSIVRLERVAVTVQDLFRLTEAGLAGEHWRRPVRFEWHGDLPSVLVDKTRLAQVIAYLTRCADRMARDGATVLVSATLRGDRPRMCIGLTREGLPTGTRPRTLGLDSNGPGDPPASWVDSDLLLSVCSALLQAHGVDLQMGPLEFQEGLFQFDLPPFPASRDGVGTVPGPVVSRL